MSSVVWDWGPAGNFVQLIHMLWVPVWDLRIGLMEQGGEVGGRDE